ncbi:MAG: phage tail protein [Enterobacter sp.]|nr:phage tail protein [Enterobacter sp.]MDU7181010.1 phage tail protein [Enterobacter roggenkampii]
MTAKYFAILTNKGAARLANAAALGTKLNLTQMAVGDANGVLPTPDPAQTKLINQKRIAPLNLLTVDPANTSQIIAEQIIPENEGGFWIREIGLYDDDGILIAVANCPETYKPELQEGSGRTQTIRMILIVSSTSAITLKIDPSAVLATRQYVDDKVIEVKSYADGIMRAHEQSRNHPDATTTAKGFTQLNSSVTDDRETQSATPKAVKIAMDNANARLAKERNLSDLPNPALARQNLQLGDSSTKNTGTTANTVAAGDDARITGAMQKSQNGADIKDVAKFLQNLGLSESGGTKSVGHSLNTPYKTTVFQRFSQHVYVTDFGPPPNGVDLNTLQIQLAIDFVYAAGGGVVDLGPYSWRIGQSPLNEIYDNFGVPVPSADCGIVLRKGVSLVGRPGKSSIFQTNNNKNIIALVANDNNVVSGFEMYSTWVIGQPGGGNGIFQLGTQGGVDISCRNTVFEDLFIHNVASYGLSIQNGNPVNIHITRCRTDYTGADGFDLKARGDISELPYGNSVSDITASRFGMRLDGCCGIDMRGVWHCRGVTAKKFGGNAAFAYTGIRFRTKAPITDPYPDSAIKSTLVGFTVEPGTEVPTAVTTRGIECGSDEVHISLGTISNVTDGVLFVGGANGPLARCSISGVTTRGCSNYGFWAGIAGDDIHISNCTDVGAGTTGFKIDGTNITTISCTGTLSVSSGAGTTFVQAGCRFGASYVVTERLNDTTVSVAARGIADNIVLRLSPKGSSHIGTHGDLRPDAANTRFIGSGSLPYSGGFTQTAFTVTSDERHKANITPFIVTSDERRMELPGLSEAEMDALLDAWGEVDYFTYQFVDRVEEKGEDNARWHFGVVAQRVVEALTNHGLRWDKYAFICYDEWDAEQEVIEVIPAVLDNDGNVLEPERVEIIQAAREAGNKYGIRYEQVLVIEAAWQRRNYQRLLPRIEALEAR